MTTAIDPAVTPSGIGCAECESTQGWWLHLRRCATRGHIGRCDDSPARHATLHARDSGQPVITTFEPSEDWFLDYRIARLTCSPQLKGPHNRPVERPAPGPAGPVPRD